MALIQEMLLDYPMGKLTLEERADIDIAIQLALQYNILTHSTIILLDMYVQGYGSDEIALEKGLEENDVIEQLRKACRIIGAITRYNDEIVLKLARNNYSPARYKYSQIETKLKNRDKEFRYN